MKKLILIAFIALSACPLLAQEKPKTETAVWNQAEFWESPAFKTPYKENLTDDEKIAGLSKYWSEVKYNFINWDKAPKLDWDALYLEYIPKVRQTKSTLEYYRTLMELNKKLRDGHTNIDLPAELTDEVYSRPLVRTRLVEDRVIIVGVYDENLKKDGLKPGQEITAIDGVAVKEYAAKNIAPFRADSTEQAAKQSIYENMLLAGALKSPVAVTLTDLDGKTLQKSLPRVRRQEIIKLFYQTKEFDFKMLPGNVAYVSLNSFGNDNAAKQFAEKYPEIAKSDALIIDIRENGGGNSSVGYAVYQYLTDKPFKTSRWFTREYRPSLRAWGEPQTTFGEEAPEVPKTVKEIYSKPVVLLTSPRTGSAAEDFAVVFKQMKRGLIVGEPTNGSTGQPLLINLPGGGRARICTKRDAFADGSEFVGVGVLPDKAIAPKISDFVSGTDAVLQAALDSLKAK